MRAELAIGATATIEVVVVFVQNSPHIELRHRRGFFIRIPLSEAADVAKLVDLGVTKFVAAELARK